jgi:hypothetical protein
MPMSRTQPKADWVADGLRFAAAIDRANLTRQRFAAMMGIGVDTLSRMLAGKQSMRDHWFRKAACDVLGCTMGQLDGDTPLFAGTSSQASETSLQAYEARFASEEGNARHWERHSDICWSRMDLSRHLFRVLKLGEFADKNPQSKRTRSKVIGAWLALIGAAATAALLAVAIMGSSYRPMIAQPQRIVIGDNWARLMDEYRPAIARYPGQHCIPGKTAKVRA